MLKRVRKRGRVVVLIKYAFSDSVLAVRDVRASSVPSHAILFLGFLLRINCDFHAIVKHRVNLGVVHDVELDGQTGSRILYSEVEPLRVTLGIDVVLHETVIFLIAHLLRQVQVATLKPRLEQQGAIIFIIRVQLVLCLVLIASTEVKTMLINASRRHCFWPPR